MAKLHHYEVILNDGEIQEFYVTDINVIYTMIKKSSVKEIKKV